MSTETQPDLHEFTSIRQNADGTIDFSVNNVMLRATASSPTVPALLSAFEMANALRAKEEAQKKILSVATTPTEPTAEAEKVSRLRALFSRKPGASKTSWRSLFSRIPLLGRLFAPAAARPIPLDPFVSHGGKPPPSNQAASPETTPPAPMPKQGMAGPTMLPIHTPTPAGAVIQQSAPAEEVSPRLAAEQAAVPASNVSEPAAPSNSAETPSAAAPTPNQGISPSKPKLLFQSITRDDEGIHVVFADGYKMLVPPHSPGDAHHLTPEYKAFSQAFEAMTQLTAAYSQEASILKEQAAEKAKELAASSQEVQGQLVRMPDSANGTPRFGIDLENGERRALNLPPAQMDLLTKQKELGLATVLVSDLAPLTLTGVQLEPGKEIVAISAAGAAQSAAGQAVPEATAEQTDQPAKEEKKSPSVEKTAPPAPSPTTKTGPTPVAHAPDGSAIYGYTDDGQPLFDPAQVKADASQAVSSEVPSSNKNTPVTREASASDVSQTSGQIAAKDTVNFQVEGNWVRGEVLEVEAATGIAKIQTTWGEICSQPLASLQRNDPPSFDTNIAQEDSPAPTTVEKKVEDPVATTASGQPSQTAEENVEPESPETTPVAEHTASEASTMPAITAEPSAPEQNAPPPAASSPAVGFVDGDFLPAKEAGEYAINTGMEIYKIRLDPEQAAKIDELHKADPIDQVRLAFVDDGLKAHQLITATRVADQDLPLISVKDLLGSEPVATVVTGKKEQTRIAQISTPKQEASLEKDPFADYVSQ